MYERRIFIISVVVYKKPEVLNITRLWPTGKSIKAGESVSLQCQFNEIPLSATQVQWFRNGSLIPTDKHHEIEEDDRLLSTLTFIDENDAKYTCSCLMVTTETNVTCNSLSIMVPAIKGIAIYVYVSTQITMVMVTIVITA